MSVQTCPPPQFLPSYPGSPPTFPNLECTCGLEWFHSQVEFHVQTGIDYIPRSILHHNAQAECPEDVLYCTASNCDIFLCYSCSHIWWWIFWEIILEFRDSLLQLHTVGLWGMFASVELSSFSMSRFTVRFVCIIVTCTKMQRKAFVCVLSNQFR